MLFSIMDDFDNILLFILLTQNQLVTILKIISRNDLTHTEFENSVPFYSKC